MSGEDAYLKKSGATRRSSSMMMMNSAAYREGRSLALLAVRGRLTGNILKVLVRLAL